MQKEISGRGLVIIQAPILVFISVHAGLEVYGLCPKAVRLAEP